jgi:hypothetical protein
MARTRIWKVLGIRENAPNSRKSTIQNPFVSRGPLRRSNISKIFFGRFGRFKRVEPKKLGKTQPAFLPLKSSEPPDVAPGRRRLLGTDYVGGRRFRFLPQLFDLATFSEP